MFGGFPVATYPYGGVEYPAGLQIVALGQAQAEVSGLNVVPISRLSLGQGTLDAVSLDASTFITIPLGQSGANAQALDSISKYLASLTQATATAQALSFSGQKIGLIQADVTAQGQNGQFNVFLDLGQGSATAQANLVIPKQVATMIFAHAIASGELIENLQIRLKIGRAESDAIALDSTTLTKLDLGQAFAEATGLDFAGIGLGLFRADSTATGLTPGLGIGIGRANSTSNALDLTTLTKPLLDNAEAIAQALGVTKQDLILTIEDATAQALDANITYLVDGVPEIVVTRSATQAVLKVLNKNQNNLRIFRADDHRGAFSVIESNWDDNTDYTDTGLDQTKNYKYVAAFVVVGTRGGVEFIVTGQRCLPVYTIGNQLL